jgi:hypothetical protein
VAETIAQFRRLIDIGTLPARQVSSTAS